MSPFAQGKSVRVLHIVGDSRFGGVAGIILGLARISKAAGWQVDVLATDPQLRVVLEKAGLGVIDLDVIRREIRPIWDLAGLLRLRKFLRAESYTIVHTHTSKAGFVGRLAARMANVPVIVHTVHGFAFHEQTRPLVRSCYCLLERMAARWCDRIVSVSEFHRSWGLALGICAPSRMDAIPNGITPRCRSEHFHRATFRHQLGIADGEQCILSLSRLAPDKGLANLIRAAAMMRSSSRRFRVLIAGEGPSRAHLERLSGDCGVNELVTFLGFREDVPEMLAAADLVVLPSLREGLSISLLEAMAAGKPIIASSIGSHREVASQAEMARLVPPNDPQALAAAVQEFLGNPALMDRLGAGAQALFEARYKEERMLAGYGELYRRLLDEKVCGVTREVAEHQPVIRAARKEDLPAIVKIHQKAFRNFLSTQLGPRFLRLYYSLVVKYRTGIILVSEERGELTGFICGFLNPRDFYRTLWDTPAFAPAALMALLRRPLLAARVARCAGHVHDAARHASTGTCELTSIAVAPDAGGKGLRETLLRAFLRKSWSMNAQSVYLTTDADGNEHANSMYRECGFQRARCFLQDRGRWLNEWVFRRAPSEASGGTPV